MNKTVGSRQARSHCHRGVRGIGAGAWRKRWEADGGSCADLRESKDQGAEVVAGIRGGPARTAFAIRCRHVVEPT